MGIELASSSIAPTSTQNLDTGDAQSAVEFTIDLTDATTFTLTGNYDPTNSGDTESQYSSTFNETIAPGTFEIDANDGTFTYTVTRAELEEAGLSTYDFTVSGTVTDPSMNSNTDPDGVTFNYIYCFAAGTGIATPAGETSVERLTQGDPVLTADGRTVPVRWVGRVTVSPMFNTADRLEPVLVRKGALDGVTPNRDLVLTADHALMLEGYAVNAGALVGAPGIEWFPWKSLGSDLTYYHVETDAHDAILANGAAAETYIDAGDRVMFDNHAEVATDAPVQAEMPAPRVTSARLMPAVLRARFGLNAAAA